MDTQPGRAKPRISATKEMEFSPNDRDDYVQDVVGRRNLEVALKKVVTRRGSGESLIIARIVVLWPGAVIR